jgi:hypothetical protein
MEGGNGERGLKINMGKTMVTVTGNEAKEKTIRKMAVWKL